MGMQVLLSAARRGRAPDDAVLVEPMLVDVALAAVLLAGALAALAALSRDHSPLIAGVCCAGFAGAVALRRRRPMLAAAVALVGVVGYELATHDPNGAFPPVAVAVTFYTIGRTGAALRHRLPAGLVIGLGLAACAIVSDGLHASAGTALSSWLLLVVVPLAVGVLLARRSGLSVRLSEVAAQLRAEEELNAAHATAEERHRVARDLHDVVAHCVSVMVVQAGAARLVATDDPAAAGESLAVIGACGRDAMADLRRIVGVLRRDTDPDFGGGIGVADLQRLADRMCDAGVRTRVSTEGETRLPPAVDVVVYRVAQEALTNVVKHAGDGATAHVRVRADAASVTVDVTNTAGGGGQQMIRSGQGLTGMRERVTALSGEVQATPTTDGGYAVQARIPLLRGDPSHDHAAVPPAGCVVRIRRAMPTWVRDAIVVVGWLAAMETEAATSTARRGPWVLNATVVGAMALAAGWRRRSPLLFLAVVGGLAAVLTNGLTSLDRATIAGLYTVGVPVYTVAAWEPRARAILGLTLWAAGAGILAVEHHAAFGGVAGAIAMATVVWSAGRVWRAQRILTAELTEANARLVAEHERRAELAVAAERTRIARELHGLVAQGVVSMVVQAEAARSLLTQEPAAVETAVRRIEQTGRDALTQLRRILGVLRATSGPPPQQREPAVVIPSRALA